MILCDKEIKKLSGMIEPFESSQVSAGKISYGLSSFGYDARIDRKFKIFSPLMQDVKAWDSSFIIDPKNFDESVMKDYECDRLVVPPHGFALGRTMERFKLPRDVVAVCVGKSTYARCGIIINVTPLEPEWEGHVTIEISNTTPYAAKIYAGEGICQFLFFRNEGGCEVSYADRKGKYQNQVEVTVARL